MKKIFLFLIAGVLLIATSKAFGQEQLEAPNYKDGDFWLFKATERDFVGSRSDPIVGDFSVEYLTGRVKVSFIDGGQKSDVSSYQSSVLQSMLGSYKGAYLGGEYLRFPLSVGTKWTVSYDAALRGSRKKQNRSVEVRVEGTDKVTTPAGAFRAYKLVREDSARAGSLWLLTYYYSPETKSIVKFLLDASVGTGSGGKREIELIKFGSR